MPPTDMVRGGGGQGGFERRIEVFVKIQKIKLGGGGGGVGLVWGGGGRVNEELKFLGKLQKKKKYFFFFLGGGGGEESRERGGGQGG